MKKKYVKPKVGIIEIEQEGSIMAQSVETVEKEFTVKTGNYEEEDNNWYSGHSTFSFDD